MVKEAASPDGGAESASLAGMLLFKGKSDHDIKSWEEEIAMRKSEASVPIAFGSSVEAEVDDISVACGVECKTERRCGLQELN
mmetsp:Transcript_43013/g.104129  ORF Transcript_43013/g.104129 Transcript_43013/m.104129 type:complete len:83 (-) Transcript_43013:106-354(-)